MDTKSFTLVELLIVIGILAILTAAVVVVLNPAELLKQARDSKRLQDLTSIDKSLQVSQAIYPDISLGTASTVYVSIADTTSTCANIGLPSLPSGWSYNCVTSANLVNSDGTGWIPVNFQDTNLVGAVQLSALPIDPTNTTSTGLYYTYTPGGSYEINSILESDKYRNDAAVVKKNLPGVVSKGTNTTLSPMYNNSGLVAYWNFEEGSGTTAQDKSGNGNTGILTNGPTWVDGKVGEHSIEFDGYDDYVDAGDILIPTSQSIIVWIKNLENPITNSDNGILSIEDGGSSYKGIQLWAATTGKLHVLVADGSSHIINQRIGDVSYNQWKCIAISYQDNDSEGLKVFIDGINVANYSTVGVGDISGNLNRLIGHRPNINYRWNGLMDDLRIYNRALSASEIQAIYNATK